MKQPEDTKTRELDLTTKRAPGRPPKGAFAMTAAEKQREYRERVKLATYKTTSFELEALSDAALSQYLKDCLTAIRDPERKTSTRRAMAARAMHEIARRYAIDLTTV